MHCNLLLLISKLLIMKLLIAFDHAVIKFQIQLNRNKELDISATYNLYINQTFLALVNGLDKDIFFKKFSMIKCGYFIEHICTSVVLKK